MNKKALSQFMGTLIIFLLVLVALGIIWVVISLIENQSPEFSIKKIGCYNETSIDINYEIPNENLTYQEVCKESNFGRSCGFNEAYDNKTFLEYGLILHIIGNNWEWIPTQGYYEKGFMNPESLMFPEREVCEEFEIESIKKLDKYVTSKNFGCLDDWCVLVPAASEKYLFGEKCECLVRYYESGNGLTWKKKYSEGGALCEEYKCGEYVVEVLNG